MFDAATYNFKRSFYVLTYWSVCSLMFFLVHVNFPTNVRPAILLSFVHLVWCVCMYACGGWGHRCLMTFVAVFSVDVGYR